MRDTIIAAITSAVVSGIVLTIIQGLWYKYVRRRMDRADREHEALKKRVSQFDENRLAEIEKQLLHAKESRGALHRKIEETTMSRQDCLLQQERIREQLAEGDRRMTRIEAMARETQEATVATSTIVKLIAEHMKIKVGD